MSLYPERKRCAACRKYFGALVLAGQWCSYECAGHPQPSADSAGWPREHYRRAHLRPLDRIEKTPYLTEEEARFAILGSVSPDELGAYLCGYCLTWHVGHIARRVDNENLTSRMGA